MNFLLVICVGGITIPLFLHLFIHGESTPLLTVISVLTALTPTLFTFFSYRIYDSGTSTRKKADSETGEHHLSKERIGDHLLYVGGILSIVLIALLIGFSGGIKDNILAYYFVFIPSATAVAFRTKKGLRYISVTSAICLIVLYCWFFGPGEDGELSRILSLVFSIYQIGLIVLLEHLTNKLPA